jgi:hypothetical protein
MCKHGMVFGVVVSEATYLGRLLLVVTYNLLLHNISQSVSLRPFFTSRLSPKAQQ